MKKLTKRDRDTYKFICEHSREWNGRFPTIRTIIVFTHHTSTSSVSYTLNKLVEFGLLDKIETPTQRFYMVLGGQNEELFSTPNAYRAIKFYDDQLARIIT